MLAIILYLFRFVRLVGSGHQAVAVENLAFASCNAGGRIQAKAALTAPRHFVQEDTIVRWQRERFRRFRSVLLIKQLLDFAARNER